jgi:hypothetical protein
MKTQEAFKARFIGRIWQAKKIDFQGVAEIIDCAEISARVLLVDKVPADLAGGDLIMVEFSTGRIVSVITRDIPVKISIWKKLCRYFNQAED